MRLVQLHLSNLRNYAQLDLAPAPGLNAFVGRNAQGKSNLLEAISLLGTGKSFRTSRERDLVRDGFELAAVSGSAEVRAGTVQLACTITATPRGTRKRYTINGRGVRYARFLGSLRVVTFVPADLQLVGGPPSARRSFLNAALAQEQQSYYHALARYQKALTQKAALLRGDAAFDESLYAIYQETLIETGTALMLAREAFVAALHGRAARAHAAWSAGAEDLALRYVPNVPYDAPVPDAVAAAFAARLRAAAAQERSRGTPLVGPHRDDMTFLLDGRSLAAYGSQGQQRTAVLALKAAEYGVMTDRSGETPLLLLDDVLSELDPERASAFVAGVGAFEQAFLTATHEPEGLAAARVYLVEAAALRAREAAV